ncbi:MAG: hypothetical protein H6825_02055 [Planctomycetes bacterium]|nr:hypothetical protein [Planctomycetota bacterium]
MLGLLHGILFLWLIASGERSPWLSFYCGLACGGFLTQAWCERKFLGYGPRVGRESPAPDGRLVQPWLFRDLVTWPLVAYLLGPPFAAFLSMALNGLAMTLDPGSRGVFESSTGGNSIVFLFGAFFLTSGPVLLLFLGTASLAMFEWRRRERRVGPATRTTTRALWAAVFTALCVGLLVCVPDREPPGRDLLTSWLGALAVLKVAWKEIALGCFASGWFTLELRDRLARHGAPRAAMDGASPRVPSPGTPERTL